MNPHAFQDRGQTATIRPDSAARTLLTSRRSAADPPARSHLLDFGMKVAQVLGNG